MLIISVINQRTVTLWELVNAEEFDKSYTRDWLRTKQWSETNDIHNLEHFSRALIHTNKKTRIQFTASSDGLIQFYKRSEKLHFHLPTALFLPRAPQISHSRKNFLFIIFAELGFSCAHTFLLYEHASREFSHTFARARCVLSHI